jgi:ketosteroid isomerase-like protein
VRGRGRVSGLELDAQCGWIVELSEGKAVGLRGYLDQREALEAAGLRR